MITGLKKNVVSLTLILLMLASTHAVAAVSPTLLEAKKEAEAKGYTFFTTHDEIVATAKKEGKLSIRTSLETANHKPLVNGFKQKYPFITDVQIEQIQGTDVFQRVLLEIKAGQAKGVDVITVTLDFAKDYIPYLMKYDIFGMAKQGVLKIDPRMVYPNERKILSLTGSIQLVAYNRKLISDDKLPAKWEDFLKPEFKEKKFFVDIRPFVFATLVPAWGLERTLDFARKIAAQQPVWLRGNTKGVTALATDEFPLFLGPTFSSVKRAMAKDPKANLRYKVIEPVPAMVIDESGGILNTADHPHAALLWFEYLASPEGQEIIDKYEPFRASVFSPSSEVAKEAKGKKLSIIDWNYFNSFDEYCAKMFEALGFPKIQ